MTRRSRIAAIAVSLLVAGCGAGTGVRDEGPLVTPDQAVVAGVRTESVTVYFVRYGVLTPLGRTVRAATPDDVVRETIRKLLDGPTPAEKAVTALPQGTRLIALRIDRFNNETTVDLAGPIPDDSQLAADPDMLLVRQRQFAIAQIVRTLNDFPQLPPVRVRANGLALTLPDATSGPPNGDPLTPASFAGVLTPSDGPTTCPGDAPKGDVPSKVTLTADAMDGRRLRFAGTTTARTGTLSVEIVQDSDQVRQPVDLNRSTAAGSVPCPRFSGALEIPYGVTGRVTLRVVVAKPNGATAPTETEQTVATGLPSVP